MKFPCLMEFADSFSDLAHRFIFTHSADYFLFDLFEILLSSSQHFPTVFLSFPFVPFGFTVRLVTWSVAVNLCVVASPVLNGIYG